MWFVRNTAQCKKRDVRVYVYMNTLISVDVYTCMSPIPFGLMRLGFLLSIMKTRANFVSDIT